MGEPVQVLVRKRGTFLNKKEIIFFSSQQHNRQQHRLHTGLLQHLPGSNFSTGFRQSG
jgi:hypothetical protein